MTNFLNPFEADIHKTERTLNQKLVEWINEIIKEDNLSFGFCEQETGGKDRKQPDVVLFRSPGSKEVILVLELKTPFFNPLDYEQVKKPALEKARVRKSPYFATSNFKTLILFSTQKANEQLPDLQQIVNRYNLSALIDINEIDEPIYKNQIIKNLKIFLRDLASYAFRGKEADQLAIDEWLILMLQEHVSVLASYYQGIIRERCLNDLGFRRKIREWFNNQGWNFVLTEESTYAKVARQTAYWLANKILFYDVLRTSDPQHYPQVKIPDDYYQNGGMLGRFIQIYFDEVLKLDYETIFSTDFIDEIAFPDNKNVVSQIRKLTNDLNRFNFAEVEFEVLGRIFEGLIPAEERHNLGQYFTNPDIVDLILAFSLKEENDLVFDPGCGAGTFLRRAYHWKKLQNSFLTHEDILPTLWGNDIDKFAVGLATINLAIADLRSAENYPRVIQKDFFAWQPGAVEISEQKRKVFLQGLGKENKETVIPKYFDAIVGNPPYTRQEEMDNLAGKGEEYKDNLIKAAVLDEGGRSYARLSKRAGLYAYFFVHGTKFLKQGGRFGFIVSNSWLDADYGKGLQEHFLKHYKIKAIIESKVERWFSEADINTCLVLLEKCEGENNGPKKEREENLVRFVTLKKPLSSFIPKASRIFEETVERKAVVEKFWQNIFSKTSVFENDDLRVFAKNQKELLEEGWDEEKKEYIGSKWEKFLRAPEIYFKILEKAKDKLIPLKEVADVRFGIKTGANEFFYLTEEEIKRREIEEEFWMHQDENGQWIPNYVIKSPKECRTITVKPEDLQYRVLLIHKDRDQLRGKRILDYIREGESQGYNERPTCASRKNWWDLGEIFPLGFLYPMIHNDRQAIFANLAEVFVDHNLFEVKPKNKEDFESLCLFCASSLSILFRELGGRVNLGEGALKTEGMDLERMPVINPLQLDARQKKLLHQWFIKNNNWEIKSIFTEVIEDENKEIKVEEKRRSLDLIIMKDILDLEEDEITFVYREVLRLVKNRLNRAESTDRKNITPQGIDLKLLAKTIIDKVGTGKLGKFYQNKVLGCEILKKVVFPDFEIVPKINQTLMGFRLEGGKEGLDFESEEEAEYCLVFWQAGYREVELVDRETIKKILPELKKIIDEVKEIILYYTEGVLDNKVIGQVEHLVWQEVSKIG